MSAQSNNNIQWQQPTIIRELRESANQHKSVAIWLTGLSGAGKSTIAHTLEIQLFQLGCKTYVLDGDNVRHGLCKDLTFTVHDRNENTRRVGEVAKLFVDAGVIVISAFISPFRQGRAVVRDLFDQDDFIEVYCNAGIDVCEKRDVKGLYAKAKLGLVQEFTGVSSPYEPPTSSELVLNTGEQTVEQCVNQILRYLFDKNILSR